MNKDQRFIAEAYDKVLEGITWAPGYKPQFDHLRVQKFSYPGAPEKVYKVEELTKDNQRISLYYYQVKPEAWNEDPDMVLNSMDISKILPEETKKAVRKEVEELELKKMGLDKETEDDWRGIITRL